MNALGKRRLDDRPDGLHEPDGPHEPDGGR